MNIAAIQHALTNIATKGTPRMALLVMALHADHRGRVQIGLRDIGRMCGVSAQIAADAVAALRAQNLILVLTEGTGTAASVYRLSVPSQAGAQEAEAAPQVIDSQAAMATDATTAQPHSVSDHIDTRPHEFWQNAKPEPALPPHVIAKAEQLAQPYPYRQHEHTPDGILTGTSDQIAAIPSWAPQNAVGRVLAAARVQRDPAMPLYWHRREHRDELDQQLSAAKVTLDQLCAALEAASAQPEAKRIRDLVAAAKRGKA